MLSSSSLLPPPIFSSFFKNTLKFGEGGGYDDGYNDDDMIIKN